MRSTVAWLGPVRTAGGGAGGGGGGAATGTAAGEVTTGCGAGGTGGIYNCVGAAAGAVSVARRVGLATAGYPMVLNSTSGPPGPNWIMSPGRSATDPVMRWRFTKVPLRLLRSVSLNAGKSGDSTSMRQCTRL